MAATRADDRLPATKAASHAGDGGVPDLDLAAGVVEVDDDRPVARRSCALARSHSASRISSPVGRGHELRGALERVEARVVQRVGERADVLDVDAVDLGHLGHEQLDEPAVGQLDDQLVDRSSAASLEDLDADDVAPDRADAAGDRAERAGTVRQPDPDHVRLHGAGGYGPVVNGSFPGRDVSSHPRPSTAIP